MLFFVLLALDSPRDATQLEPETPRKWSAVGTVVRYTRLPFGKYKFSITKAASVANI